MREELISVIIPVYNVEQYLKKCLNSIIHNTYQELEIIMIDDGSNDSSGKICDEYCKLDERFKVYHQSNHGVSASRNYGIRCSTGKYITFIDSDDYIEDDYFEQLLKSIKSKNAELAVCTVGHKLGKNIRWEDGEKKEFEIDFQQMDESTSSKFYYLNKNYLLYGPCNKLYYSNIIINNKIIFPEDTSYGEDLLFNFHYLQCCHKICFTSGTMYIYNHENMTSLSHIYRKNMFENGLRLNNTIKEFSMKHKLYDTRMQEYWAGRVFDDAYNSLFALWNKEGHLTEEEKRRRISFIMNSKEVREACTYADTKKYSKFYTGLIKFRCAELFYLIRKIKRD